VGCPEPRPIEAELGAGDRPQTAAQNQAAGVTNMQDIVEVKALGKYCVYLRFKDGVSGNLDLAPIIGKFTGVFRPLKDPSYFAKVAVSKDLGTIFWPNGADIDPLVLYSHVTGKPISALLNPKVGKAQQEKPRPVPKNKKMAATPDNYRLAAARRNRYNPSK
jgi:hypothetical protein